MFFTITFVLLSCSLSTIKLTFYAMQDFGRVPDYIQRKLIDLRIARRLDEEKNKEEAEAKKNEQVYLLKTGGSDATKGETLKRSDYQYLGSAEKDALIKVRLFNAESLFYAK